jgi:hypothetical protein
MENQMEHNEFKELIQFYMYNELEKDKRVMMEEHLKNCKDCSNEFESYKKLFDELSKELDGDVNPVVLTEARSELRGFIRADKSKQSFVSKLSIIISSFISKPFGLAFSGASILLIGLFTGYLIFNQPKTIIEDDNKVLLDQINIKNINFIDSDPSDGQVEFTFDAIKPGRIKGKIDNPELQRILTYALLNEQNPGTRLNSINVLNASKFTVVDDEVKKSLMKVTMFDENPGVRREALIALKEIPFDEEIKNTLIYVLLNDTSSGLRIESINSLVDASKKGFNFSKDDLSTLKQKTEADENKYVKYQVKNIIKEY